MIESGIDWSADSYASLCERHRWNIPDRLNIAHVACDRHADGSQRVALIERDEELRRRSFTFDELARLSSGLAFGLRETGIERGDRVAVFLPQCVENPIAHLAIMKLGAISVPLSPLFREEALVHRLRSSGARAIIVSPSLLETLASALDDRDPIIVLTTEPGGDFWKLAERDGPRFPIANTGPNDPAMLIYTSGTSGLPKGALHGHRFMPARLPGFEAIHRLESDRSKAGPFWTPADWAWVGGLVDSVLTPMFFGHPVLALARKSFDPERAFQVMELEKVRSLFLPPTALNILRRVAEPRTKYRLAVSYTHSAGEPLRADTHQWAEQTFGSVFEIYGMTEVGALIGSSPWVPVRPGSMGRPFPGHVIELLDDRGQPIVGPSEGEIGVLRTDPGMFLGYWNDPAATEARFRGDYLATGDMARRDRDGYFWYLGRNDDMLNTSGYRVGPAEIEACLENHPSVLQAAIVGEPDDQRGTIIKAFVVLKPDYSGGLRTAEILRDHVKSRLAAHEYPRKFVFTDHLPLTVTGKVRRTALREPDADQKYGGSDAHRV